MYSHLGLSVIINRINKPNITVGVDGSLYRYHPRFKRNMEKCMKILVNKNIKVCINREDKVHRKTHTFQFDLQLSNDGSGIGAALTVAAEVLSSEEKKKSSIKQKSRRRPQV